MPCHTEYESERKAATFVLEEDSFDGVNEQEIRGKWRNLLSIMRHKQENEIENKLSMSSNQSQHIGTVTGS